MDEALHIIAYQRDQIREQESYIKALEMGIRILGAMVLVATITVICLFC